MRLPRVESKTVEFKTTFNRETIETLVAFANTDGGSVYVGVRDDGKVVGVQLASDTETTWLNEIKGKTTPGLVPEAERITIRGKTVVRLCIGALPVKPAAVQGRYYGRKGKSNHLMSPAELAALHMASTGISWDGLPDARDLDEISLEKVSAFAKKMNPEHPDAPLRVLRKLGLLVGKKPTHACWLAFAGDYCPETAFQVGRFKTPTLIIDTRSFNGDLFGELEAVLEFIRHHLMAGFIITGKPEHDIRYDYPPEAIREIVLNMLVHRDYCGLGINTVKIFDDRMEFTNPGGLPNGLTVRAILSDRYVSSPRNPKLAALFKDAGLIERYGSGIKRILDACQMHGGVKATFEDHGNWFTVILRKTVTATPTKEEGGSQKEAQNASQKSSQKILAIISAEPGCTTEHLAVRLGLSRRAVASQIAKLKANGCLIRVGGDKGGHWVVSADFDTGLPHDVTSLSHAHSVQGNAHGGSQNTSQKSSQKILALLSTQPGCTTEQLAIRLGLSRRTIARQIAGLKNAGSLIRVGGDHGGHWKVLGVDSGKLDDGLEPTTGQRKKSRALLSSPFVQVAQKDAQKDSLESSLESSQKEGQKGTTKEAHADDA